MTKFLLAQLNLFCLALGFFSRIPMPKNLDYSPEKLNQSSRYFSLVGLCLAALLAIVVWVLMPLFSPVITILLMMAASLLLTGAFHEDGLADMADGIGGGYTVSRRLEIMKDSRVGTYGVVTLVTVLALKTALLTSLLTHVVQGSFAFVTFVMVLLAGYAGSRAISGSLIFDMAYVTEDLQSKSKPLAAKQTGAELLLLGAIGLLPFLYFSWSLLLSSLIALLLFRYGFKYWLNLRLGGFTGDCLGAAQQLAEVIIYLVFIAMLR